MAARGQGDGHRGAGPGVVAPSAASTTTCGSAWVTYSLEQPDIPAAAMATTTDAVHRGTRRRTGLTRCPSSLAWAYLAPGERRWAGPVSWSST